jgi:hypothetical protein
MRAIDIDLGYGRTKMFAGNGCKSNYPSVVSSRVPIHTFGDTTFNPVEVKGITYLVSDEAERHARSVEDTRRIDFVCSPSWFALLGNALRIARLDPFTDVMTIGLPPGAGIYFCYTMNHHDALTQDVAVIDVGHETLDMIFMAKGTYIEKWKETKNLGVSRELDAIIQLERSSLRGKHLGYGDIVARMTHDRGLITQGSDDYVPGSLELLQAYTRTVMSTIQAYLDLTHGADVCLIGGGGARFLVPDRDYGYLLLDDPERSFGPSRNTGISGRWPTRSATGPGRSRTPENPKGLCRQRPRNVEDLPP